MSFIRRIRLRRGNKTDLPALAEGEPAFVKDEQEIYVGTSSGNINLTNRTGFAAHLESKTPHKFVDHGGGSEYQYGLKQDGGHMVFVYEEVQ